MFRTWKQPRYALADKWIRKFWFIYTVEYYSAVRRNTFESVLLRWKNLEPVLQSGVSEREKQIPHIKTYILNLERRYQRSYVQGKKGDRRKEQTFGLSGRRRGLGDLRQ